MNKTQAKAYADLVISQLKKKVEEYNRDVENNISQIMTKDDKSAIDHAKEMDGLKEMINDLIGFKPGPFRSFQDQVEYNIVRNHQINVFKMEQEYKERLMNEAILSDVENTDVNQMVEQLFSEITNES